MYIINNYQKKKFHNNNPFKHMMNLAINNKFKKLIFLFIFLLILVPLSTGCTNKENFNKGKWIVVQDEMSKKRNFATANLLPDGNVLIMGGEDNSTDTADIFDSNQMKIIKTIFLDDKRYFNYSATTLKNGSVFVAGGWSPSKINETTKVFDSKTYSFKNTKPMKQKIYSPITYLLPNNNVLILNNIIKPGGEDREKTRFEIFNPNKDEYYETKNMTHRMVIGTKHMILDDGNILFHCYSVFPNTRENTKGSACLYDWKTNKFEVADDFPKGELFIQLDSETYLTITPALEHSEGYIYNIKTKEKVQVENKINRTWRPGIYPQVVLLENGNVLILGIILKNRSDKYELEGRNRKTSKYSAYIYNRKDNKFYEVTPPPYDVYNAGLVKLKNGDILMAGGKLKYGKSSNKIQIYTYEH